MEDTDQRDANFDELDGAQEAGKPDPAQQNLEAEVASYKDKYLRALAEFENFKKRALKERSDLLRYQGEPVLGDMLPVLDNLERSLQHTDDAAAFKQGVELILKQFLDVLAKWEVKPVPAVGQIFDPVKHNALGRVPVDDAQPGTILTELKRGYLFKDRLLRAGDVVVAVENSKDEKETSSSQ